MSCRYCGLNYPFTAYAIAETPNVFQWAGQHAKIAPVKMLTLSNTQLVPWPRQTAPK